MKFQQLPLLCECGRKPARIKAVGFTAANQLVVHWRCPACRKFIYVLKDLADRQPQCAEPTVDANDAEFLRSMGICEL
jgi:hypothetical protein